MLRGWFVSTLLVVPLLGFAPARATVVNQPRHAAFSPSGTPYWPGWDVVRGVALQHNGPGGYTVDAWGGLHPWGGAPPLSVTRYIEEFDWATGVALLGNDQGGAVSDRADNAYAFGTIDRNDIVNNTFYNFCSGGYQNWGVETRGISFDPVPDASGLFSVNGAAIDMWGGIHPLSCWYKLDTAGAPYWPGWDVARGVAVKPGGGGGFVLDAWGGIHAFGRAQVGSTSGYWPGWDIARGIAIDSHGNGVVVDGWGGLHAFTYG